MCLAGTLTKPKTKPKHFIVITQFNVTVLLHIRNLGTTSTRPQTKGPPTTGPLFVSWVNSSPDSSRALSWCVGKIDHWFGMQEPRKSEPAFKESQINLKKLLRMSESWKHCTKFFFAENLIRNRFLWSSLWPWAAAGFEGPVVGEALTTLAAAKVTSTTETSCRQKPSNQILTDQLHYLLNELHCLC